VVQVAQRTGGALEQGLTALDGPEPIGAEQRGNLLLELLLLQIETSLPALDPARQLVHRHAERAHHRRVEGRGVSRGARARQHVAQARLEAAREQRQRLGREHVFFQEEADDRGPQPRQGILAGAEHAGAVDPREQPLCAQPRDGVRRALSHRARIPLDHDRGLLEVLEQLLLAERGIARALAAQVERRQKTQIQRRQLELRRPRGQRQKRGGFAGRWVG